MVVDYLELSSERRRKAEEFCLSSGSDCVIRVNVLLKEITRIRNGKERRQFWAIQEINVQRASLTLIMYQIDYIMNKCAWK